MREIKFRGMNIQGRWFKGNLSVIKNKINVSEPGSYISNAYGMPFAYMVRPETVGQFTGLKDKYGTEIYENDLYKNPLGHTLKIIFDISEASYVGESLKTGKKYPLLNSSGHLKGEVVGNIYEEESK